MLLDKQRLGDDRLAQVGLALAAVATLVFTVVGAAVRPAMYSDSSFGFMVWDSMRRGSAFNFLVFPDAADIARDGTAFATTWTPGQYLLPGLLETMGLDLGVSIVVVVGLASALGLWGWYALYRTFGFSPRTCTAALLLIVFNRQFTLPFGIYNGGEVLIFGAIPWGFLLVWRLRALPWWSPLPLVAATAVMVFMKLSGIIFMGAAISAVVPSGRPPWINRDTVRKAVVAGGTLVACAALFQWAWLSRGWSVVQAVGQTDWSVLAKALPFTVSATWTSIFSFGGLFLYLFFFPGRQLLASDQVLNLLLVPPALATAAFVWWRLRRDYPDYVRFAFFATAAMIVFFVGLWLRGGDVSMEERHFRPISLLLTVGVVEAFLGARSRIVRGLFAAMAGLAALYGVASFVQHARTNLKDTLGTRGVRLHNTSAPVLDFLATVDKVDPDGTRPLFYVPMPEMALEPRNARIVSGLADFEPHAVLATQVRRGKVRRLYVALQKKLVDNGKADIILKSFTDIPADAWKKTTLGDFVVFAATPAP